MDVAVVFRPHLIEVLEYLSNNYELVVFTASEKVYADPIIDHIDPQGEFFSTRLYRDSCQQIDRFFIKDLRIIEDRELSQMFIVDNSILSFAFQLANGVPISDFTGLRSQIADQELLFLVQYIEYSENFADVRDYNRESLMLEKLMEEHADDD